MSKINQKSGEINCHQKIAGKIRLLQKLSSNSLWKYIGSVLLAYTYGKKEYMISSSTTIKELGKETGKIDKDIQGKPNLLKASFSVYFLHYTLLI